MSGYRRRRSANAEAMRDGYYHTGDVAARDADGYITYVGRADDVFKASDYRISPFELESVLIEHPAVAEAAVVPAPDPLRLAVPKAYVVLAAGWEPDARDGAGRSSRYAARAPRAVQARSAGWSSPSCRRRSPARSAGSSCARRRTAAQRPRRGRVSRGGLPRAQGVAAAGLAFSRVPFLRRGPAGSRAP